MYTNNTKCDIVKLINTLLNFTKKYSIGILLKLNFKIE